MAARHERRRAGLDPRARYLLKSAELKMKTVFRMKTPLRTELKTAIKVLDAFARQPGLELRPHRIGSAVDATTDHSDLKADRKPRPTCLAAYMSSYV